MPHGVQYNNRLYPSNLEPWNHSGMLIDPTTGEPCPMEVVGDFKAMGPIFKGCYGDSLLYSDDDLAQLRWQKVYFSTFHEEIPMPPVPSYWQDRELAAAKQSPHRAAALDMSTESRKTKHSSSKGGPPQGAGHNSNTSTLIPLLPRNLPIPRNQPWTARQSLHRIAAPGSVVTCPFPLQGQWDANKGIFME